MYEFFFFGWLSRIQGIPSLLLVLLLLLLLLLLRETMTMMTAVMMISAHTAFLWKIYNVCTAVLCALPSLSLSLSCAFLRSRSPKIRKTSRIIGHAVSEDRTRHNFQRSFEEERKTFLTTESGVGVCFFRFLLVTTMCVSLNVCND